MRKKPMKNHKRGSTITIPKITLMPWQERMYKTPGKFRVAIPRGSISRSNASRTTLLETNLVEMWNKRMGESLTEKMKFYSMMPKVKSKSISAKQLI